MRAHELATFAALLAVTVSSAWGDPPPNVVESDGSSNTAMGDSALGSLTDGTANTAAGTSALSSNTSGSANVAFGAAALTSNIDGDYNTAVGEGAMYGNTSGSRNTGLGFYALDLNETGHDNVGTGYQALYLGTTGNFNTGIGSGALYRIGAGYRNVAIGYRAGYAQKSNDNITIGATAFGKATDKGVIRIGTQYQVKTFISGISGVKTGLATAAAVFIDANGQLGTIKSSREFKEDIQPMASASERLYALNPVTFHYKDAYDDGSKPLEYGLIAEEVAEAFPELVVRDANGKPQTVRYDLISTLLLNEFKKDHAEVAELRAQVADVTELKQQVAAMAAVIERMQQERATAGGR